MLDNLFADTLRVFFQIHFRNVFPAGGGLRGHIAAGARNVVLAIDGVGVNVAIDLQNVLLDGRAFGGCEILVFTAEAE